MTLDFFTKVGSIPPPTGLDPGGCCGMKNLHVLLMVSLLTCAGGVAIAQDYDAGLKAAQAGDFQTALKEWKPLADQGDAGRPEQPRSDVRRRRGCAGR